MGFFLKKVILRTKAFIFDRIQSLLRIIVSQIPEKRLNIAQ